MDTLRIIQKEGYRIKDLSNDNQLVMKGYHFAIEDIKRAFYNIEDEIETMPLGNIIKEVSEFIKTEMMEIMERDAAELQIGLAEGEDDGSK